LKKIITLFVSSLILALMSSPAMATTPTKLGITTQPSGAVNGIAFTGQPVIAIQNSGGNTVTGASNVVTVTKASGDGFLSGPLTATAVNGVATFSDLKIEGTGAHTLIFTADGLSPVTSAPFTVAAFSAAAHLILKTQPAGAVNDLAFEIQPVISIMDSLGNPVTTDSSTVVTVAKASGSGTLTKEGGGTLTATASSGLATFSGLKIVGTGAHTLIFTAVGLSSDTTGSFTIGVGTANQLVVTTPPSGADNDVAFTGQPVIAIKDSGGNTVTTDSSTEVTVAKASGSGTLSGTLTATAINGVATFSDLKIVGTGAHTLIFTSGALSSVTSTSFTVAAATSSSEGGSSTVTTPDTAPAPTPGFFSGKKWTITIDDAGVSTLDINLAKSQAGKNASFYKRTKQGKLILLDEEQRLGKNGEASITTDKLLRTGQKVRVQVDGKFRSTVTMP